MWFRRVLYILVLLPFQFAAAQEQKTAPKDSSLEQDILHFKSERTVLIANARELILKEISINHFARVDSIITYLDQKFATESLLWLHPTERLLLDLVEGDARTFRDLKTVEVLFTRQPKDPQKIVVIPADGLLQQLLNLIKKDETAILQRFKSNQANAEEIDFLSLLHQYLFAETPQDREKINEAADQFLSFHSQSDYESIVRLHLRYRYVRSPWGFGFDFFSGRGSFDNNLGKLLPAHVPLGVMFDIYYKNVAVFIVDHIGIPVKPKREFVAGDQTWSSPARFNVYYFSLDLGYLIQKPPFWVTPFLGGSVQNISVCEADEHKGYSQKTPFVTAFTYGLQIDFALPFGRNSSVFRNGHSYWTLRLRVGQSNANFESKFDRQFNGNLTFIQIGFGGIGWKMVREF